MARRRLPRPTAAVQRLAFDRRLTMPVLSGVSLVWLIGMWRLFGDDPATGLAAALVGGVGLIWAATGLACWAVGRWMQGTPLVPLLVWLRAWGLTALPAWGLIVVWGLEPGTALGAGALLLLGQAGLAVLVIRALLQVPWPRALGVLILGALLWGAVAEALTFASCFLLAQSIPRDAW